VAARWARPCVVTRSIELTRCFPSWRHLPHEKGAAGGPQRDRLVEPPDGQHTVSAKVVGDAWSFGPHSVGVYANNALLFSAEISNDGKALNQSNHEMVWMGREATLTLSGEEHKDAVYRIVFRSGGVSYSQIS
jgi:hypothetical protein